MLLGISNMYVRQEANSNVLLNGMTLHNGTTRNTTRLTLAGEHAELYLCGMAIADKNQHVDNHTLLSVFWRLYTRRYLILSIFPQRCEKINGRKVSMWNISTSSHTI